MGPHLNLAQTLGYIGGGDEEQGEIELWRQVSLIDR